MSRWTHVMGTVLVDTVAQSDAQATFMTHTVLEHLPLITGSERNVRPYFIIPEGPNWSLENDEFGNKSNLCTDPYCGTFEVQTQRLVVVHGELRDRLFEQTLRETTNWLARLSSRLCVTYCLVSVRDDQHRQFIFNDPEWIIKREVNNWTLELLGSKLRYEERI